MKNYKIAVAGTGYVGLSIATLLSQHHQVTAVDIVPEKVEMINNHKSPIQDDYIEKYLAEKKLNLTATLDAKAAYSDADFVVIATPTNYDSHTQHFDTSAVEVVIKLVMKYNPNAIMVIKSTIPVGYTASVREKFGSKNIIFSPEFLRESKALYDNLYPSRIIVGTDLNDERLVEAAHEFAGLLQEGAIRENIDTLFMGFTEAEAVKLNASEIVLYIGQSFDINSSVPKGTAAYYRLYSSSNSKIAAVTRGGGVVKGVATGKATVTCTLNNGKKAICNVYIMPQSKKISNVPLIGQSKLPTGCETCSATMLLNFYGYKISETTFADKYLVKKPFGYSNGSYTGPDPNCAFVGTPYSSNSYGAYAPIMVKCMNKYLSDKSYKAVEISGKSLEYLSGKYVAQGQPIMVWATINMSPSFKTTTWRVNYTDENAKYKLGSYYTWTAGEHCLLLTGYDKDYYYFNDPWTNARTRYSKSLVNTRYNELGKQAVVMVKK